MVEAAFLPLPFPEVGVVEEDTLKEQNLALAAGLPERPVVLGGCCCAHVGAVGGLSARYDRLAVVWFDAHGDLNTPETSPSGNEWGMPLRMLIDSETVKAEDVALVGARALDPAEEEFIAASGLHVGREAASAAAREADAVYVALDVDVLDPDGEVAPFMPTPGGPTAAETMATLTHLAEWSPIAGVGFSGLTAAAQNSLALTRFAEALRL